MFEFWLLAAGIVVSVVFGIIAYVNGYMRIFSIADVCGTLTSHRPFKERLSFEETISIPSKGSGQHFDPKLLEQFGNIASELNKRYGGRDDDELCQELRDMVNRN